MLPGSTDNSTMDRLERKMEQGFSEIKAMISALDQRLRALEQSDARNEGVQEVRMQVVEAKAADLQHRVATLEGAVKRHEPWIAGAKWLAGALGGLIVVLIWSILTHTVQISP